MMSSESEDGQGRGLPVGWGWRPPTTYTHAWLGRDGDRPEDAIAVARSFGHWTVFRDRSTRIIAEGHAKPRDGEDATVAAQREAVAALWARDGFGVGEVRGVRLGYINELYRVTLPGLSGLWHVRAVRKTMEGVEVDAVRAPVAEPAPMPWNWCPTCKQHIDIDADNHEGERVRCLGCRVRYVVCRDGDGVWSLQSEAEHDAEEDEPAPREPPAPTDDPGDELARLLPMVRRDMGAMLAASSEPGVNGPAIGRLALACKLLLGERERLAEEVAQLSARVRVADSLELCTRCAIGGVPPTATDPLPATTYTHDAAKALRARVAELEAEREANRATVTGMDLGRFSFERWHADDGHDGPLPCPPWSEIGGDRRSRWSMSAVAIYDRAHAHLSRRIAEAERKLSNVADLQRSTAADLDAARAQLRLVSAGPSDVWRWQGDGHDDPASLACPVVMSAATLREFVATRERVATLEATPPPGTGTVAALLAKVEEEASKAHETASNNRDSVPRSNEHLGREAGLREAARLITATLGAPTPLDLAVAEVLDAARALPPGTPIGRKLRDTEGAIESRAIYLRRAVLCLAGMLACDAPADGGGKEQSK